MTVATSTASTTASYNHRLATAEDTSAIAPLIADFAQKRAKIDPSMTVKPDFDFEEYVSYLIAKPLSYCWVLEQISNDNPEENKIVGCLFIYFYDEAPPVGVPEYLVKQHYIENPFQPRRVGSVLAMYIQPEHRQPELIKQLANAAIQMAEEMQVTDIDLLISQDQTGIHALLEKSGFTKAATQYTRHYNISTDAELPRLHPPLPEIAETDIVSTPEASAIPLRDINTKELIRNSEGEPIFLYPLKDENGEVILTSKGLPIYPHPVRDPQKNEWIFDHAGELVVYPILRDENGQIVEHEGIPQFLPPIYQCIDGKILLKQDSHGNYVFSDVERDRHGNILRSPSGAPIFNNY